MTNNGRTQNRCASNAWLTALFAACASVAAFAPSAALAGQYRIIYRFKDQLNGGSSVAGLTVDPQGRLYGTTQNGGAFGSGTVFRLTRPPSGAGPWAGEILHSFDLTSGSGRDPQAPVTLGADGSVYGDTPFGGSYRRGNLFKLTNAPNWPETVLHNFARTEGGFTAAGLVFGPDGLLYGTTPYFSFTQQNGGTAFNVSPLGDQVEYKVLHRFGKFGDGVGPVGLTSVPPPHFPGFLGAAIYGGTNQTGTVFALQAGTGAETTLYSFGPAPDVSSPYESPIIGVGAVYHSFFGCAGAGGTHGIGGIYQLTQIGTTRAVTEQVLYNFGDQPNDPRPSNGQCGIVQGDLSGRLYGTTNTGGTADQGTFFELDPPTTPGAAWTEKVDLNFDLNVTLGVEPFGVPLRIGNSYYGTLLMTAPARGYSGLVYELTP